MDIFSCFLLFIHQNITKCATIPYRRGVRGLRERIDIFVDAGSHKGNFGVGVIAFFKGSEIFCISKHIPQELNINDIANAELYAIVVALKEVVSAKISNLEISVHTDSSAALMAASGSRFKGCIDNLYSNLRSYTGTLKKTLGNTLLFTKIDSEYNHGKAHDIATDASKGKEYKIGSFTVTNYSNLPEVAITIDNDIESESDNKNIGTDLLFNGANISKILKDSEMKFKSSIGDLTTKEKEINSLKAHIEELKKRIDKISETNDILSDNNNSKNLELDKVLLSKTTKETLLKESLSKLAKQNNAISTKNELLYKIETQFKLEKAENAMRIKFLKEDFERLSIKTYNMESTLREEFCLIRKQIN